MKVKDTMSTDVKCIRPNNSIQEAADQMRSLDVGILPVCGDNDKLVGVLTDRDIVTRSAASGNDPKQVLVSDIMTQKVHYCHDDQDVTEAAQQMREQQVRRLLVINQDKRLVGIISLGDLAVRSDEDKCCEETLEAVSVRV
jgi:CBS domain-containing protein